MTRTIDEVIDALTTTISKLNEMPYEQMWGYTQREADSLQMILDYIMGKRDTITD